MTLGAGVLAGSWVLILTVLMLDLAGVLRRGTGFRWQAAGLLIINSAAVIGGFAHRQRHSEWSALQPIIFPAMLIGFPVFGTGLVIQAKARRRERHPAS